MNKSLNLLSLALILIVHFISESLAQNQSPTVENVKFSQRINGSNFVDVYYDVNDPDGDVVTITMEVSNDDGTTWDFSCNNISGDVGTGIASGTDKHIIWDFAAEHPQTFGDQFRIIVWADDGSGPGGGETCPSIPIVVYNDKVYQTVLIGDQCWLKENIDIGIMINGEQRQSDNGIIEKFCYNNDPANCVMYGGLYEWGEAMQYSQAPGAQGICPTGWHIPDEWEYQELQFLVNNDGNALKQLGQGSGEGEGTNISGFSALLAGELSSTSYTRVFAYLGLKTTIFSSSSYLGLGGTPLLMVLWSDNNNINIWTSGSDDGYSVRCLKD